MLLLLLLGVVGYYYTTRFTERAEKALYPLEQRQYIDQYAGEYGLEPAHVAAVILCESSYDPNAVSAVGARGLMQIMPDTGEWIAGKLGESESYSSDRLFEPELNIRYGCWYLSYLKDRFDGDMRKVTAAYHAGDNRVRQWLEDEAYSTDGQTLDTIPYKETNKYVKRVLAAYERYQELYPDL